MKKIYIDQNILTRLYDDNNKTNLDIILNSKKIKLNIIILLDIFMIFFL